MTVSPQDYEKLIEDTLKDELDWLVEEFDQLFKEKNKKYTQEDITIANQILDQVIDGIKTNNSEELLNLLAITLNRIETKFPEFF
ncbi:MAG: hypothetical protein ACFFC3_15540 [Candidatus Odinarchaeota archaeon]